MSDRKIISLHASRGGAGTSSVTANVAACAVRDGRRVAVLDMNLPSAGAHVLFGCDRSEIEKTLVDCLEGTCSIGETACDVTERVDRGASGRCYLVPASLTAQALTRILDDGYDAERLATHVDALVDELDLDALLIDTHPGLHKESLLTTALADTLVLLVRPDREDYHGAAVLTELAAKLDVPRVQLIANKILSCLDPEAFRRRLADAYGGEVIGMIPLSEDLAQLESRALICVAHPDHEVSTIIRDIASRMLAS